MTNFQPDLIMFLPQCSWKRACSQCLRSATLPFPWCSRIFIPIRDSNNFKPLIYFAGTICYIKKISTLGTPNPLHIIESQRRSEASFINTPCYWILAFSSGHSECGGTCFWYPSGLTCSLSLHLEIAMYSGLYLVCNKFWGWESSSFSWVKT